MREEMQRVQNSTKLDMNLDKARVSAELSAISSKIKASGAQLDTQCAQLNSEIDGAKWRTISTIAYGSVSLGMAIIGYLGFKTPV